MIHLYATVQVLHASSGGGILRPLGSKGTVFFRPRRVRFDLRPNQLVRCRVLRPPKPNERVECLHMEPVTDDPRNLAHILAAFAADPDSRDELWEALPELVRGALVRDDPEQMSADFWACAPRAAAEVPLADLARALRSHVARYQCDAAELQSGFDDLDHNLAKAWARLSNGLNELGARAARCAEKAAAEVLRRLGADVDDISIHQITGESADYEVYDLRVRKNGCTEYVDVKHTRTNSWGGPPTLLVRRTKQHRGKDVQLVGMVSQFPGIDGPVYYLGKTCQARIEALQQRFEQARVELVIRDREGGPRIPSWVFDAPRFEADLDDSWARWHDALGNEFLLDRFKLHLEPLREADRALTICPTLLCQKLRQRISLPELYLALVEAFFELIERGEPWDTASYGALFPAVLPCYRNSENYIDVRCWPLGLYDPLCNVYKLANGLAALAKQQSRWQRYLTDTRCIRIYDGHLIRLYDDQRGERTLLTWCGRRGTPKQPACRRWPIVAGAVGWCALGRLRCPTCGYCCEDHMPQSPRSW